MAKLPALGSLLLNYLSEGERLEILQEAHLKDDRPSILRGQGGPVEPGFNWIERHRATLTPLILRHVDPPDIFISDLVADGDLQVPVGGRVPQTILLTGLDTMEGQEEDVPVGYLLHQLAASSALVLQVFLDVAAANEPCGIKLTPPAIAIKRGSLEITVGGGLFASGMGLLVACSAGLVGAPLVGAIAGVSLATAGVIDLALGWRKGIAEVRKTHREASKIDAEGRLTEINVKLKELELERAKLEGDRLYGPHALPVQRPESAEVPRSLVLQQAERFTMVEGYANHVLNRALGSTRLLKQKMAGVQINILSDTGGGRRR